LRFTDATEVVTKASNIPPGMQKEVQEAFPLTGKRHRVLEAVLNPENAGMSTSSICAAAGFSRDTYYNAFQDPRFTAFLARIQQIKYPYQRSELARQIIEDAMTPMKEAFRVEHGDRGPEVIPYHASVVKTREQAASILGLTIKQPDLSLVQSQNINVHLFKGVPDDVLGEFTKTKKWPARAGKPPWEKA